MNSGMSSGYGQPWSSQNGAVTLSVSCASASIALSSNMSSSAGPAAPGTGPAPATVASAASSAPQGTAASPGWPSGGGLLGGLARGGPARPEACHATVQVGPERAAVT